MTDKPTPVSNEHMEKWCAAYDKASAEGLDLMSAPTDTELETLVQCQDCNGAGCSDCDGLGETLGLDCYEQAASDAIDKLAGEMADRYDCGTDPGDCADVAALSLLAAAYRSAGAMRLDLQNLCAELARAEQVER